MCFINLSKQLKEVKRTLYKIHLTLQMLKQEERKKTQHRRYMYL